MVQYKRRPLPRWPLWQCLIPLDDAECDLCKGSVYVFVQMRMKDWSIATVACGRVTAFDGDYGRGVYYEALDSYGGDCCIPYNEYVQDGFEWHIVPAEFC